MFCLGCNIFGASVSGGITSLSNINVLGSIKKLESECFMSGMGLLVITLSMWCAFCFVRVFTCGLDSSPTYLHRQGVNRHHYYLLVLPSSSF